MPRASLFEPAHVARWLRVPTVVVRDRGGARGAERGHSAAVCRGHEPGHERAERQGHIRQWPRTNSRRAAGRQWRLAGGLQAALAATRTSPDTLGPGPRAGSSGAGHRASRGAVVQRRSEISDELPLDLSSD